MTVNEIKDMINSTISENGERGITGQALNLALNAIADALANAGGGLETVYISESEETITQEQQAANAAVFAKAKAAYEAGQPLPGVQLYMPSAMVAGSGSVGCTLSVATAYIAPDTEAAELNGYGLMIRIVMGSDDLVIMVNEDGTLTAI